MRHYPYFISDALLLFVLLILVPAIALYMVPASFSIAVVSVLVFALFFKMSIGRIKDFEASVRGIQGVRSWESDFMSLGTLVFDYKGDDIRYRSAMRGKAQGNISMDYVMDAENGSKKGFSIRNQGEGWLKEFSVSGDRKLLSSLKKDISAFSERYRIEELTNADGHLHAEVNLLFSQGPPPSKKDKLEDMAGFLGDYLELVYKVNKRLKARK